MFMVKIVLFVSLFFVIVQCNKSNPIQRPVETEISTDIYGRVIIQYQYGLILELTSIEDGSDTTLWPFNKVWLQETIRIQHRKSDGEELIFHNKYSEFNYTKAYEPSPILTWPELWKLLADTSCLVLFLQDSNAKKQAFLSCQNLKIKNNVKLIGLSNGDSLYEEMNYSAGLTFIDSLNLTKHGTSYRFKTYVDDPPYLCDTSMLLFVKKGDNFWSMWP
jgi:hypothetical protein